MIFKELHILYSIICNYIFTLHFLHKIENYSKKKKKRSYIHFHKGK